ncbi:A-kinase anchor protein 17B-like [Spea bombifrons]|uniref:A-kinase anchor protein 17B-like n=1 Tax=Spea bombifrons TaxID=233779 RepID=UPI00234A334D|nr:A-kinase anchor protein 17B-like [Spea bombifrons]
MAVITVYDTSEAVELNAAHRLYLKPKAKLVITVILPEEQDLCRPIASWEIIEQLKNLVDPYDFSFIKVTKTTKEFVRVESETDTKILAELFTEKLNGQKLQISSLNEPLSVEVTESPTDSPPSQELLSLLIEQDQEDLIENDLFPPCIHVDGLPCKWFSPWISGAEKPSEEILKVTFEKYGRITQIDIPMLDPYREEPDGNSNQLNPGCLQTFDAFILYGDKVSCINAIQALQGQKLMFTGEDGKSLSCDIKLTLDTTSHFSEEAVNRRNAERLKLQELEQQRKQEKQEEEALRKKALIRYRARRRRAKLKRRLQKQKECEQKKAQECEICTDEGVDDTQEWEDRKLLLAQRRVESIKLLSLLLDKVNDLVQVRRQNEEAMDCNITNDSSELSPYSVKSRIVSLTITDEEGCSQHETEPEEMESDVSYSSTVHIPQEKSQSKSLVHKDVWYCDIFHCIPHEEREDELKNEQELYFDNPNFKLSHPQNGFKDSYCRRRKVYETEEFIHYLLNYYHCPEYPRLFLENRDCGNKSWCQRVVQCEGNNFQIKLKRKTGNLPEMGYMTDADQHMEEGGSREKRTVHEPEEKAQDILDCKIISNEIQIPLVETEHEAPSVRSHVKQHEQDYPRTWKNEERSQSSETNNELKDVLEQISSTSEYFSEEPNETIKKQVNIRKIPRKIRNLRKIRSCCFSEHNGASNCCHEDILEHFLHSYSVCRGLKKHSRCRQTPPCQKKMSKTNFHVRYDTETSGSDTEKDDRIVLKAKRMKKKIHPQCFNEGPYRDSSLTETSTSESWGPQPYKTRKHLRRRGICNAHQHWKSKRRLDQWEYCCPGDESSSQNESVSIEQDEHSLLEPDESPSCEKSSKLCNPRHRHQSGETDHSGVRSKGSFSDYLDWEQHFYRGKLC